MYKINKILFILITILFMTITTACTGEVEVVTFPSGQIHLYGEIHGFEAHIDKQFELWYYYYTNRNMRHMFLELPFFIAQFLNMWMAGYDEDILENLFYDARRIALNTTVYRGFFHRIRRELPETVFHGYDIGHIWAGETAGIRFLEHLRQNGLENSDKYLITLENIEQGKLFSTEKSGNHSWRADRMVENFIREFESLNGESIMSGFAGCDHIALGNYSPFLRGGITMATQLIEIYGDNVHTTRLLDVVSSYVGGTPDLLIVENREYNAMFFGYRDISDWHDTFVRQEFWRLEDAYEDFRNHIRNGVRVPLGEFPMPVETGQILAIRSTRQDGSSEMRYFRSSIMVSNIYVVEEFLVEE